MIFSTSDEKYIMNELQKLMLFYPANLVINVVLNRVACDYLDLNLQFDDISEKYRKLHFTTYFKKFHKFSYLDPTSNHPSYVFKGLIKEARNSFLGLWVYLLKSKFRTEGKLRFPCYYTIFSTYDQSLLSHWFPSNSCHHSNGNGQPLILKNVEYLEN